MRLQVDILRSIGRKLCPTLLLVCCVGLASAQSYSPFSGGTRYSNGLSISSLSNEHVAEQAGSSGRYSGLSGGRTTFDPGYQLSGGVPKSLVENPFFAEQDHNPYEEKSQYRGAIDIDEPSEEDRLPVGDPIVPLMLMLLGYTVWKITKKTRLS